MRIWHEKLFPKLCQKHLNGIWNEGNQVYEIITCEKITYKDKEYRKYCNTCGHRNYSDRCKNKKCKKYNHNKNLGKRLDGYFYHPAVKEFEYAPFALYIRLGKIRKEMLARGYHPKELPSKPSIEKSGTFESYKEWQTLKKQIEILHSKECNCQI